MRGKNMNGMTAPLRGPNLGASYEPNAGYQLFPFFTVSNTPAPFPNLCDGINILGLANCPGNSNGLTKNDKVWITPNSPNFDPHNSFPCNIGTQFRAGPNRKINGFSIALRNGLDPTQPPAASGVYIQLEIMEGWDIDRTAESTNLVQSPATGSFFKPTTTGGGVAATSDAADVTSGAVINPTTIGVSGSDGVDARAIKTDNTGQILLGQVADPLDTNIAQVGDAAIALGQTVMATSFPVVVASDQTPIPVTLGQPADPLDCNIQEIGDAAVSLGQKVMASSIPVVLASDQSTVNVAFAQPADPLDTNISEFGDAAVSLGQKVMASSIPVVVASDDVVNIQGPTGSAKVTMKTVAVGNVATQMVAANATRKGVILTLNVANGNTVFVGFDNTVVTGLVAAAGGGTEITQGGSISFLFASYTGALFAIASGAANPVMAVLEW